MNNDLISRSALKKAIESWKEKDEYYHRVKFGYIPFSEVYDLIDNAPTIAYPFYQEAYQTGYEEGKNERPIGEWIIDGHHIRCNRCNEYICNTDREGNKIPDKFCPNCGADMREADLVNNSQKLVKDLVNEEEADNE